MILLDPDRRTLADGGASIRLTPMEAALIAALAGRQMATYDQLIMVIYGDNEPEGAREVLRVMVCLIRRKIVAAGWSPLIKNAWGRGYLLGRPVEVVRRETSVRDPIGTPRRSRAPAVLSPRPGRRGSRPGLLRGPVALPSQIPVTLLPPR